MQTTMPGRARNQRGLVRKRSAVGALSIALAISAGLVNSGPAFALFDEAVVGFELADGNLQAQGAINFDWNNFTAASWGGTAPKRSTSLTVNGWKLAGLEDAGASTGDSAFAGGTKQDADCATVGTGKAPNKDDLKRVYVTSKTVDGDVILGLAWVRIPQNTTSPSAHIGFEFNKGSISCGSSGLVKRTPGDMLIVYDFEGGSTDAPSLSLRRWVTSGACEVGSNSPPCWSATVQNLTAEGNAAGAVNTGASALDEVGPANETLGPNEFGEAGINLTDAGVFNANSCESFGSAYAVSRSSGNSATAQMKDIVGPGPVNITNCGGVIIRKATSPSPDPTDSTFSYTTTGGLSPSSFDLKNGQSRNFGSSLFAGAYSVTESDPGTSFALTSIDCSASSVSNGTTINTDTATRTVSFDLKPLDTVDCTFVNTLQTGAIKVTKMRKHAAAPGTGDVPHAGVDFTIGGVTKATDSNGEACFDGLTFGEYTVTETVPAGYVVDGNNKKVTVDNAATCAGTYTGETVSFLNTPLTNVTVEVNSQVDGGTASTIRCVDASDALKGEGSTGANGDGSVTVNNLLPTAAEGEQNPTPTLICTITVDP